MKRIGKGAKKEVDKVQVLTKENKSLKVNIETLNKEIETLKKNTQK